MSDPTQEQIDAFYQELFEDPEFQEELQKIMRELVHRHLVLGEPFESPYFGGSNGV